MISKFLKNPIYKKYRTLLICLVDLFIVAVSYFFALYIASMNFILSEIEDMEQGSIFEGFILTLIIYLASFLIFRIYKSLWKYTGPSEVIRIVLAVMVAVLFSLLARPFLPIRGMELRTIVVTGVFVILLMCNVRLGYRLLRRHESEGKKTKNAVIIGAGDAGYILCKEIIQNHDFDANIVGFIDDARAGKMVYGKKVLADTDHMGEVVEKHKITMAFIAIPSASKKDIRRIYELCRNLNLETKIMKQGDELLENPDAPKHYPVEDISIEDLLGRGEIHLDQHEISSYISGKVIAVTGAGGSIGSELCRQIVKFKPKELLMIDINAGTRIQS
mgnify:FL=1